MYVSAAPGLAPARQTTHFAAFRIANPFATESALQVCLREKLGFVPSGYRRNDGPGSACRVAHHNGMNWVMSLAPEPILLVTVGDGSPRAGVPKDQERVLLPGRAESGSQYEATSRARVTS